LNSDQHETVEEELSARWKIGVILTVIIGFSVLVWIAFLAYQDAPPIPEKIVDPSGQTVLTGADILAGQQVFLRYGLMENGSIWGHGAYLGPDFSARYLHTLGEDAVRRQADYLYGLEPDQLPQQVRDSVTADIRRSLRTNRYDADSGTLTFTELESSSFRN
jgi:nitric oxide reductase subunit B